MRRPTTNIVSGWQLRAARVLAGLTQAQLAQQAGFHERACRYWEARGNDPPTTTPSSLAKIEAALGLMAGHGIPHVDIARVIMSSRTGRGIDPTTLRSAFRHELDVGH